MAVSAGAGSGPVMSVGCKTIIPFLTLEVKTIEVKCMDNVKECIYHLSHVACSWQTTASGLPPHGYGGPVLVVESQDLILGVITKSGPVDPATTAADVRLLDIVKIYGDFALNPSDPVRRGVDVDRGRGQRHSLVLLG